MVNNEKAIKMAEEISKRLRKKSAAEEAMDDEKGGKVQPVPMPNQQEFLSSEQDDQYELSNKEDFLADGKDDISILNGIMQRLRMGQMKKRSV